MFKVRIFKHGATEACAVLHASTAAGRRLIEGRARQLGYEVLGGMVPSTVGMPLPPSPKRNGR